ncbi:MAG TPA: NAD(P)/FAD-dependent oxidoreductase [Planctomycetota bacterium]|jgi:phytoene dehydrogenase-like protein
MSESHYDCVIIGAGMSGLAAGIRLAHFGKRVCILERHSMPGGLNSFYQIGGRKFDVGLHAVTNFVTKETKAAPLTKLLRQLRIRYDELDLSPQMHSEVRFPTATLRFSNDIALLTEQIASKFPAQVDGFRRLVERLQALEATQALDLHAPARQALGEFITEPLLIEMLLCPLMYYGSAWEDDMQFGQMAIMFKSIFCEGFGRPRAGVRQIISTLIRHFKGNHGELRLNRGAKRLLIEKGRVAGVELEDGYVITADAVLSSAGLVETLALRPDLAPAQRADLYSHAGRMTFVESISVLDALPIDLGLDFTIVFYNDRDIFQYRPPEEPVDLHSGVVCCPNNFQYLKPLDEGLVRITHMANYAFWTSQSPELYSKHKSEWYEQSAAAVSRIVPDFRQHVKNIDVFTPRTIERFTGHVNGAVYGSTNKTGDGRTDLENLFLCGTDQGFLGIVGALLSGIMMANAHVLKGRS